VDILTPHSSHHEEHSVPTRWSASENRRKTFPSAFHNYLCQAKRSLTRTDKRRWAQRSILSSLPDLDPRPLRNLAPFTMSDINATRLPGFFVVIGYIGDDDIITRGEK
jgi:hypothetical protein